MRNSMKQILTGQRVLESDKWKLEPAPATSCLPKKKRIGEHLLLVA